MADGADPQLVKQTERAVVAAIPAIVAAFAKCQGVRWFLAFHGEPVVWLVTETDADKAVLLDSGVLRSEVQRALSAAGVADELVVRARVTVESEETVARDFDGKWHYAMR